MEDHWNSLVDVPWVRFQRSWIHETIYEARFAWDNDRWRIAEAWVCSSNPPYIIQSPAYEQELLAGLVDELTGREINFDRLHLLKTVVQPFPRSYWVQPGWLLAGFYPGDQDESKAQHKIDRLADVGIRHIVNLVPSHSISSEGKSFRPYEQHLHGRDVTVSHMPMDDYHPPAANFMREILDDIDQAMAAGKPVYVHCGSGRTRTSTVIACWLVRRGYATPKDAIATLQRFRSVAADGKASPTRPAFRAFIERWDEWSPPPEEDE